MVRKAIAKYLTENGIRQNFLSQKTGISPQAICLILKGERNLDVEEYAKICEALGVSCNYFIEEAKKTA